MGSFVGKAGEPHKEWPFVSWPRKTSSCTAVSIQAVSMVDSLCRPVLTGGPLRVTSGLALLTSGQIEQLLISGVHADFSTRSLTAIARGAKLDTKLDRLISCCITLGYAAHDTVGNAKETALWAALYEVTSVRVVTAQYHMARALLEFDAAMPHVAIIADPVFPPDVKQDTWYRWPGTLFLFTQEYSKLQLARLRVRLQQLLPNLRS